MISWKFKVLTLYFLVGFNDCRTDVPPPGLQQNLGVGDKFASSLHHAADQTTSALTEGRVRNISNSVLPRTRKLPRVPTVTSVPLPQNATALLPQPPPWAQPLPNRSGSVLQVRHGARLRSAQLHSAVIVEDRAAKALVVIINHMRRHLPNTTLFHVFHSPANYALLQSEYAGWIQSGGMRLTNLQTLNITHVTRYSSNWLYLNEEFWQLLYGENILIFQMDSCICSRSRHKLSEFVGRYDFVGGPYANPTRSRHQNGGFSLRVRSKMIEAIRRLKPRWEQHFTNEDIFFSVWAAEAKILRPAPVPVARAFCIDSMFYESPFAVHKIHARLHQFQLAKRPLATLLKNCPEVQMMVRFAAKGK
eukprot:EG_transcript_16226